MPQELVSGTFVEPENLQYRGMVGQLDYQQIYRPNQQSHATPSSAIHELHMTGDNTWNKLYNLDFDLERRDIVASQQPQVVVNYVRNNPAAMIEAAPIPIAQYAINTGLIYVGPNSGSFGGIKVGNISGAPNGY
jgi:hypothetical protein